MTDWIKRVSLPPAGDLTILSASPASDEGREQFWSAMAAAPADPFFEVTVGPGRVSVSRAAERAGRGEPLSLSQSASSYVSVHRRATRAFGGRGGLGSLLRQRMKRLAALE